MGSRTAVSPEHRYRIGAVSRLTGVAPDTLRVWERRYGAVAPTRSASGTRLYTSEDIRRLTLIKRLLDGGDAISQVANLSTELLQNRAQGEVVPDDAPAVHGPCRVLLLGPGLVERMKVDSDAARELEIVGAYRERDTSLLGTPRLKPDLVVLEYTTVQPEQIREIGTLLLRSGAARALVVYGFASRATLDRLESPRITPLRGPIDFPELRRWCLALHAGRNQAAALSFDGALDISGPLPARRFDETALARIAESSSAVRCECPHHLVDLISRLTAFETYSEECEVLHADDAALHAFLHSATAQARALLEVALTRVMEVEQAAIDDDI